MEFAHPLHRLMGSAGGRVLEALWSAADAGVHLRELARGAAVSLSSLQRELEVLDALGVLSRRKSGNRTLHRLRRDEPFARLLLAAATALDLQGFSFDAMPSNRDAEMALARLCAHIPADAGLWRRYGDERFLAGLAVTLAGHRGFDRSLYLALAESLSPGASTVEAYQAWYAKYRPDFPRLLSMIDRERRTDARIEDQ
jgi:hypothetical protein